MKFIKHCSRCVFTTVIMDTGEKDSSGQPLKTLKEYRMVNGKGEKLYKESPIFSNDFVPIKYGEVKIGDTVYMSS